MAGPPITILLIEDNPPDARLIEIMLGKAKGAVFEMERVDRLSAGLERLADGGVQHFFDLAAVPACLFECPGPVEAFHQTPVLNFPSTSRKEENRVPRPG